MIGFTSAGMSKPLSVSHVSSALESVAWSCTVAYGPTFSCFVTVTPPGRRVAPRRAPRRGVRSRRRRSCWAAPGSSAAGGVICVAVSASTEANRTSALSPTSTVPWMGSTHANDVGLPE